MNYYKKYYEKKNLSFEDYFSSLTHEDVKHVINKTTLNELDFLTLLSPAAEPFLEDMGQKAQQVTIQHFGKVMQLFAPLYISDHCVNQCLYCSYSINNDFPRKKLTLSEIEAEAKVIAETGIEHLLILTGESRLHASIDYLKESITILKKYFSSLSIELHPLKTEEYRELIQCGITGLTVYQEVYNEDIYKQIHVKGPKRNYSYRLDTPERGCKAGISKVNIGALLGMDDWRKEVFFTGIHAAYLKHKYAETEIGIGFPRMRPHLGDFQPKTNVTDKNLLQAMIAMRLFLPESDIILSTREQPELRDHLISMGVTKMSAASSTAVGGYVNKETSHSQFEISDERSVDKIKDMLHINDYQTR
ncbi:2-iminoacetate synthase ThiH [Ectobacillus panaciterrae]|uniref:2-iminoacetate synthase ThiH n=1 Tax=Ectobacillus panaciterrae TaxID=363872 RepID=UPI0003FF9326|nr:2-iminoacetate synthase ThiH [Ectobacillus panaciterrae]